MKTVGAKRYGSAALIILIVLQLLMLCSLFTRTEPHPPLSIPLFGLAPFLSAAIAVACAALFLRSGAVKREGMFLSILAAILALISFGPQKWIDPAIDKIWPAVALGQIAALAVFWAAYQMAGDKGL
ncbi:hypothetical protein EJ066_04120 [Mesorhizobium sp. M9A.F.Ca.ET.002.03.1.2]|uniref:hypothetical protein n=1 Tax=Mesorhizobium sp. M9A.F.Ca.ET.002.03.1.2 TaxID=2493668 RepID=UPI000F7569ED|nr:hypothetical protein [Mesorhizobium sp. M9A.F.Ca.ET.002.03.1.2]AZN96537.1 hypothetical protein EJ066_04120 [Mesorhizobium sp. M9A.F.Ca.ET.002.03.1.2]